MRYMSLHIVRVICCILHSMYNVAHSIDYTSYKRQWETDIKHRTCTHIYIYTYMHMHIYIERERETYGRALEPGGPD